MKQFFSFVIKESRHIMRDRRTMLILFGMPVVMMLLFGFAISTDVRNVRTVVVGSTIDHRTQEAAEAINASEYFDIVAVVNTPAEAESLMRRQQADIALVFEHGFGSGKGRVQVMADGADPNMAQLYSEYATQILMQHIAAWQGTDVPSPVSVKLLYNPQMRSSYNFVPGIMGMLLMLVCAMMTSISIVREKERGTMEVLLVSPVRPLMIIIAKMIPYLLLAFLILAAILCMSKYLLGVPLAGSLGWIIAVSAVYILVALSLGLLISTLVKTQLAALLASAMMLILPCVLLSGMIFPVESMPVPLQWLSAIMPPRYYIAAMRRLMIMGVGIGSCLRELSVLCTMATILLSIALLKFNKRLK